VAGSKLFKLLASPRATASKSSSRDASETSLIQLTVSYSGDTTVSTGLLRVPRSDFVPFLDPDHLWNVLANSRRPDHPLKSMGTAFNAAIAHQQTNPAKNLAAVSKSLENLALYSLQADDYVAGKPNAPTLDVMADQRNMIQHGLMSLMNIHNAPESISPLLRLCHLASMVYSFLCVFPVGHAPFRALVFRIRSVITEAGARTTCPTATQQLVLWALCLTGIVVKPGTGSSTWVLTMLDEYLERLEIPSWKAFRDAMLGFLWLPITNDQDGVRLWSEIVAFREERARRLGSQSRVADSP
jgi:hypothetical protein